MNPRRKMRTHTFMAMSLQSEEPESVIADCYRLVELMRACLSRPPTFNRMLQLHLIEMPKKEESFIFYRLQKMSNAVRPTFFAGFAGDAEEDAKMAMMMNPLPLTSFVRRRTK